MKIVVTGASGFIGGFLCERLIREGYEVIAVGRGTKQLSSGLVQHDVGDLGPNTNLRPLLQGVHAVVHLAARVHEQGPATNQSQKLFFDINVEGTRSVALQAREHGVRHLVFVSSVKAVGETSGAAPLTEQTPCSPQDDYGRSKLEAEIVLRELGDDRRFGTTIVRPPLVYGPGVRANFLSLLRAVDAGVPLPFKKTTNRRSLVYVENMVDAIVCCLRNAEALGQTFFVSDGPAPSMHELTEQLARALGKRARLFSAPTSLLEIVGAVLRKSAHIQRLTGSLEVSDEKIRELLNWAPPFTLEQSLARTVLWYRESKKLAKERAGKNSAG